MIYFIRNTRGKAIKIGVSHDPMRRLQSLQTAHHDRLEIIGIISGGHVEEAELHRRFAAHRLRREWFRSNPELLDFIERSRVRDWPSNVWIECFNRDGCRAGLIGVRMKHVPTGRDFTCDGSEWKEDKILFLAMSDGWFDPGFEPIEREFGIVLGSDIDLDHYHFPEMIPASECVLLSSWPIACCPGKER